MPCWNISRLFSNYILVTLKDAVNCVTQIITMSTYIDPTGRLKKALLSFFNHKLNSFFIHSSTLYTKKSSGIYNVIYNLRRFTWYSISGTSQIKQWWWFDMFERLIHLFISKRWIIVQTLPLLRRERRHRLTSPISQVVIVGTLRTQASSTTLILEGNKGLTVSPSRE